MRRFNLVLATRGGSAFADDLETIARHVEEIDPEINAVVLRRGVGRRLIRSYLWAMPTLSVALQRTGGRSLLPGRLLKPTTLLKAGEYQRLEAAGFPVPKWTVVTPETVLDPQEWGPYVVEKPNFGGLGAYIRIRRTTRLRYKPSEAFASEHFGRKGAMLAQEFIFTGEWPQSFRVMTLFGQAVLCMHQRTMGRGKPLSGRWGFGQDSGTSIVSNTKDMEVTLVKDSEVVSLCENAHRAAFPDIPLLGFDVIRDADSGRLYILECHSHGPNWAFSSDRGRGVQDKNGLDFVSQYDAFRKSAGILAAATRRLAARRFPFQALNGNWAPGESGGG